MSDSTIDRVIAEGALASRYKSEIDERASKADIPTLVDSVEKLVVPGGPSDSPPDPTPPIIAFDTDGVPYLTIGEPDGDSST